MLTVITKATEHMSSLIIAPELTHTPTITIATSLLLIAMDMATIVLIIVEDPIPQIGEPQHIAIPIITLV